MNQNRRKFLKFLLIGTGLLLIWKYFPIKLGGPEKKEIKYGDFKIVEEGDKLIFFNQKGERVFTLNKEGEIEVGE
jgi:signal peptidase I